MVQITDRKGLVTFGERLAEAREEAGMTQRELADRTGLSQTQISRMESGGRLQRPSPSMVKILAESMDLSLVELVSRTPLKPMILELDEPMDEDSGHHLHYCPNPFCSRNQIKASPVRTYTILWKSAERVMRAEFAQVEFCGHCGTKLIRCCPHCGKRIRQAPEYFCCRCGRQIHDRPTALERRILAELHGRCDQSFPPLLGGDGDDPGPDGPGGTDGETPAAQDPDTSPLKGEGGPSGAGEGVAQVGAPVAHAPSPGPSGHPLPWEQESVRSHLIYAR